MRNKELIALLQEQDPEADVTWNEEIECVIIQEG